MRIGLSEQRMVETRSESRRFRDLRINRFGLIQEPQREREVFGVDPSVERRSR